MKNILIFLFFLFHFQSFYGFGIKLIFINVGDIKTEQLICELIQENRIEKKLIFLDESKDILNQNDEKNIVPFSESTSVKLITVLTVLLITILTILSLALYKNNIIRNETNTQLIAKNKELVIAKNKAEEALISRQEFIATVSHELRTPLNAIHGLTYILINESPNESQRRYLEPLMFSSEYLRNLIDDILEINRIERDKIVVVHKNTSIRKLVINIFDSFRDSKSDNEVRFILDIDSKIPDYFRIDTLKLSQILNNLIHNASKFTEGGMVKLALQLKNVQEDTYTILFKVEDSGIGISEEYQKRIFENFSQGSKDINRKYGGTGIGLAIVNKLVQVMGGEIKVESELGRGSVFSFELKLEKCEDVVERNHPILTIDKMIYINKSILLVEDNKINQMVTKKILEKYQMKVSIAETGEEAVTMAKNGQFDLILMDIHLPGINGTEATHQIRVFDQDIPIIGLTAISLNENRENLMSYGLDDIITKPFDVENFYFIMAQYLRDHD